MTVNVAHQQLLRGTAASLNVTLLDADGEPADAAGAVTVRAQKADGTDVLPAGTATTNPAGTGTYSVSLTAAQTATLDLLTATWTDAGDGSTHTTLHEIVGGYYFTVAEARAVETSLADTTKFPTSLIQQVRREVEEEFERICDVSFVPRFRRVRLDSLGTYELLLPNAKIRTVRSVRVYSTAASFMAFTVDELAGIEPTDWGVIRSSVAPFTRGVQNIVIEYEHGYPRPPVEVKRAALSRLRQRLNFARSGIPDNAQSWVTEGGSTFRIAVPGAFETGSPEIDAVLQRFSLRVPSAV